MNDQNFECVSCGQKTNNLEYWETLKPESDMFFCPNCIRRTKIYKTLEGKYEDLTAPQSCTTIYIEIVNESGRIKKTFDAKNLKNIRFFEKLLEEHQKSNN